MRIGRKVIRNMAKWQLAREGFQHPCRKHTIPGTNLFRRCDRTGKVSFFASNWRKAAARNPLFPSQESKHRKARRA